MLPTIQQMEQKLNELYTHGFDEYSEHLEMIKSLGYRVLRNSQGQHKLELNPNYLNEVFGGIFGGV